jgi:cytoskeleton protein RodZ
LQEIGQRLRLTREERGVSLEAVEADTKIRRKYLEALEEGREVDIPGDVYLKGFLRTYGNYLDLDGTALVEEYKASGAPRQEEMEPTGQGPVSETDQRRELSSRRQAARAALQSNGTPAVPSRPLPTRDLVSSFRSLLSALVVIGVVAGVGYVGWLIALQLGGLVDAQPLAPISEVPPAPVAPEPTPTPKLPDPPPPAKVVMTRGTGEDVIFTVPVKEFTVQMEIAGKAVWMEAEVDGQIRFRGTATATAPASFTGGQMRIRAGHMDDVSLVVHGQRFEKPLKSGPFWLIFKGE